MSLRALAGAAAVTWVLAFSAAVTTAQAPDSTLGEPGIPAPVGYVNDRAGLLGETERAQLEGFLDQVQRKTGAEFAVLTVRSTEPLTPSEYKVKVFEQWKLGKRGKDNGLLMLVVVDAHEVRFETGYGLEGALPDGFQSRVVREDMAPRFQASDFAGGIRAGVLRCAAKIAADAGVTLEWDGRALTYTETGPRRAPPSALALILFVLILVIVLSRLGGGGFGGPYRRRGMMGPFWGGFGGGLGGLGGLGGFGGGLGGGGFGGGGFGGFGGGASGGGGGGGKW